MKRYRFRLLIAAFVLIITLLLPAGLVQADSLGVQASVPASSPTRPADFSAGLNNATVSDALAILTGSCENINPVAIISIWRDGIAVGSTACGSNGTFSVNVMLEPGVNTLIARTATIADNYGPDSTPIRITLRPADAQPASAAAGTPAGPDTTTHNAAAKADLKVSTTDSFTVLSDDNTARIGLQIDGGQQPYHTQIMWDDGETNETVVDSASTNYYNHTYKLRRIYSVRGNVKDANGAVASFNHVVVTKTAAAPAVSAGALDKAGPSPPIQTWQAVTAAGTVATIAVASFALTPWGVGLKQSLELAGTKGLWLSQSGASWAGDHVSQHSLRLWDQRDKLPALATLALMAGGGIFGYQWWNAPATGTAATSAVHAEEARLEPSPVEWRTTRFLTKRPASWQLQPGQTSKSSAMDSYVLSDKTANSSAQLTVTTAKLGNSQLAEIPAIKLRTNDPGSYQRITIDGLPASGLAFQNIATSEISLFWQHGSEYAALVGSATGGQQTVLREVLDTILTNWRWL